MIITTFTVLVHTFKTIKNDKLIIIGFWLNLIGWCIQNGLNLWPVPPIHAKYFLKMLLKAISCNCASKITFSGGSILWRSVILEAKFERRSLKWYLFLRHKVKFRVPHLLLRNVWTKLFRGASLNIFQGLH